MATTTKTAKDDGRLQIAEWNDVYRRGGDALLRIADGKAQRGDGVLVARAGLDDPGKAHLELIRLRAVEIQRRKAGSAADFHTVRETHDETAPRVAAGISFIDEESRKLQQRLNELSHEKRLLSDELQAAEASLSAMVGARSRLRQPDLLPPHVVVELHARRNTVASETRERRQQLSELIQTLNADAGRLAGQTDSFGELQNELMLSEFATRSAANASHRGHEYWRDRFYSLSEWMRYEAWAGQRAAEAQRELDELKSAAAAKLHDEIEELSSFYLNDIE